MFGGFSFDDTPRSPSWGSDRSSMTREPSRSVSPCTTHSTFPRPAFSVTDLAVQFGNQRIRKDSQIHYDSCEAYANNDDDDAAWAVPPLVMEHDRGACPQPPTSCVAPPRPHSPTRRLARQLNTRLLCSSAHQRDITALVSRLVARDQCNILPSAAGPSTPSSEDEGYDSAGSSLATAASRHSSASQPRPGLIGYRRASDMNRTGACVSKNIKLRKGVEYTRQRSSGKQ